MKTIITALRRGTAAAALAAFGLISGCTTDSMQTAGAVVAVGALDGQAPRRVCDRAPGDTSTYLSCVKQADKDEAAWRAERAKKAAASKPFGETRPAR